MLLRHALLREIATAAARLFPSAPPNSLFSLLRDLELVDLVDLPVVNNVIRTPPASTHWKRQLDTPMPDQPSVSIRQFLETTTDFSRAEVKPLGAFRDSLAHLQTLDTESLQFLTQGTLDLSSYRLDAWITSYATKRLASMTRNGPIGQYIGGYGWVENLVPKSAPAQVAPAAVPPGEQTPLYAFAKDSGFIHAPSVAQASAAALLRNAHLGPSGVVDDASPFAIDLSSSRVREANRLLDGVRQGQPLTALCGYRLERRLHELSLDRFIAPLRNVAPLAVREREINGAPTAAVAANNVVDALTLLRMRQSDPNLAALNVELGKVQGSTSTDWDQVKHEITALADTVDGLSDALIAESAYQMARGNTTRLASTLTAIAQGDSPPPELEVARTPRTGTAITHRVVVLFSGDTSVNWGSQNERSVFDRWLNAWLRSQLGDAQKIRCTVEQLDDTTGAVTATATFPLSAVPTTPIDFVYNVQPAGQSKDAGSAPSVAEQWVLYHARRMTHGFGADAALRLQHSRPSNLAAGESTLFDALQQARWIRALLRNARSLRPEDISPPEGSLARIDLVDLESRIVHYEGELSNAHTALFGLVAASTSTAEALRAAMLRVGTLGIGPAVPNIAVGDTLEIRAALVQQANALLKDSQARLDRDTALKAQAAASDPRARCEQLLERGRAVYGNEFISLPLLYDDGTVLDDVRSHAAGQADDRRNDFAVEHGRSRRHEHVVSDELHESWFQLVQRRAPGLGQPGNCATQCRRSVHQFRQRFGCATRWERHALGTVRRFQYDRGHRHACARRCDFRIAADTGNRSSGHDEPARDDRALPYADCAESDLDQCDPRGAERSVHGHAEQRRTESLERLDQLSGQTSNGVAPLGECNGRLRQWCGRPARRCDGALQLDPGFEQSGRDRHTPRGSSDAGVDDPVVQHVHARYQDRERVARAEADDLCIERELRPSGDRRLEHDDVHGDARKSGSEPGERDAARLDQSRHRAPSGGCCGQRQLRKWSGRAAHRQLRSDRPDHSVQHEHRERDAP
jgi:hypothetical protein